jgi:hypothetical protein
MAAWSIRLLRCRQLEQAREQAVQVAAPVST